MESVLDRVIKQNTENVNLLKTKDYNIFSVLQIQSKEVLICRMIADLLNPRGQHGAGAEYLKIFLRDCLGMEKMDTKLADQAIVTAEYAIDDERRIDIVIEIGSYFLPIEVKIYAADQKSQCFDYYQYAKRRDAQAKVYYLTLDGHRPGKDSTSSGSQSVPEEDIVCLSFREHILNWLKACKSCENTGMVPILEQFIQNIEQISGYTSEKVRNMVIDELLKSGDSLRAGMQIADSINAAKAKLIYLVFEEFEKQLAGVAERNHWTREKKKTPELREKLIIEYSPLVKLVAGRLSMYLGYNVEYDDLVSYGIFGLIDAIDKFDLGKEVKFETYASLRIRGTILDQIRKMDWIPRTVRQKQKKIDEAIKQVEMRTGKNASDEEIAQELGLSEDELTTWQSQLKVTNIVSLNEYLEQGAEPVMDARRNSHFIQPEDKVEEEELKQKLEESLEVLTEKERKVILLYYYEDLTLKEISSILEVSESRISQLHTKALLKMRKKLGNYLGILIDRE